MNKILKIGEVIRDPDDLIWLIRNESLYIPENHWADDSLAVSLKYEYDVIELCKSLSINYRVFIDVGAHVGTYCVRLSPYFKQVYAIEPSLNIKSCLDINLFLNNANNVTTFNYGFSDKNFDTKMYLRGGCSQLTTLNIENSQDANISELMKRHLETEDVKIRTLDSTLNITDPFIIKIDTEGSELDILYGAKNHLKIPSIWIIEDHEYVYDLKDRIKDINDFMNEYNFSLIHEFYKVNCGGHKLVFSNRERIK